MLSRLARASGMLVARLWRSGALAGALLMVCLFAVEMTGVRLQMMGVHDAGLQGTLIGRLGGRMLVQQFEILLAYATIGLAFGGLTATAGWLWDRALEQRRSIRHRWARAAIGTLFLHGWRLTVSIVRYPQLFDDMLYARGGARRGLQVALTEHVPQAALEWVGWAMLVAAFVGPLATRAGRRWLAEARRYRRPAATALVGCLLVGLAPNGWHGWRPEHVAPGEPPNLLLIAVDSLRADRVTPRVAPRLAALAERSVRFDAAYVTVPRTFPSWVTLLSGRWPSRHGIRHMFPNRAAREAVGRLLPEILAERGLSTVVVSDFSGEIFSRLPAGFQRRDVPFFDLQVVVAQAGFNLHPSLAPYSATALGHRLATSLAAAPENADPGWLADRAIAALHGSRAPFFMTVFFSAPHFPYAAPDPYYRRFTRPGYARRFRYSKPVAALETHDGEIVDDDIAQVRGLYDGAVAAVDHAAGRILDELEHDGLAGRTIVVLLADHGEQLYERGRSMGHGEHLYGDEVLHIPLAIYDPVHAYAPHSVPGVVRDVDLAPTLAALYGTTMPEADGVDLRPLLEGARAELGLTAFAETGLWLTPSGFGYQSEERIPYPALPELLTAAEDNDLVLASSLTERVLVAKHRAIRSGRWKLHYAPTLAGIRWTLYDLAADRDETVDVATAHPDVVADLRARLYRWMTLDGSIVQAGFVVPR